MCRHPAIILISQTGTRCLFAWLFYIQRDEYRETAAAATPGPQQRKDNMRGDG